MMYQEISRRKLISFFTCLLYFLFLFVPTLNQAYFSSPCRQLDFLNVFLSFLVPFHLFFQFNLLSSSFLKYIHFSMRQYSHELNYFFD